MAEKKDKPKTGIERERKFLVKKLPRRLARHPHQLIEQGYLAIENDGEKSVVRLRRTANHFVITVKKGRGQCRMETEVPLPPSSARALWPLTSGRRVKKVRYRIPYKRHLIELDIFRDKLRGLVLAEVEFPSNAAMRRFVPPPWFGKEVTGVKSYANSELAVAGWKHAKKSRK